MFAGFEQSVRQDSLVLGVRTDVDAPMVPHVTIFPECVFVLLAGEDQHVTEVSDPL